jgi:hypothetical protein
MDANSASAGRPATADEKGILMTAEYPAAATIR